MIGKSDDRQRVEYVMSTRHRQRDTQISTVWADHLKVGLKTIRDQIDRSIIRFRVNPKRQKFPTDRWQ